MSLSATVPSAPSVFSVENEVIPVTGCCKDSPVFMSLLRTDSRQERLTFLTGAHTQQNNLFLICKGSLLVAVMISVAMTAINKMTLFYTEIWFSRPFDLPSELVTLTL